MQLRAQSGRVLNSVLLGLVLMVAAVAGGYCAGRYLIGKRLMGQGASTIRSAESLGRVERQAEQTPSEPEQVWSEGDEDSNVVGPEEWRPADQGGTRVQIDERKQARQSRERRSEQPRATEETPRPVVADTQPKTGAHRYTLQVGAFLDERNSRVLVDDLNNRGYRANVKTERNTGGSLHRVHTGEFSSEAEARRAANELRREGYTVVVTPE